MGASESKLAFKEDIFRLAGEPDIPADSQWWTRFYQLPESADDVFALWSPHDLRSLTNNNDADRPARNTQCPPKKNVETLIYTVIARLQILQTKHVYSDPHQPVAPEVLNCVRILTRLLPYIYEADHLTAWEEKFFWQPRQPTWVWDKKHNRKGELFDGLSPEKKLTEEDEEIGPPLGEQLIDFLINYLFFPNFTLPKKLDSQGRPDLQITYAIWQSGIGCKQSLGMTKEHERNAMEVVRLLLTLTSRSMYIRPDFVATSDIKPLTYLTTKSSRQVVLSLICSLLNTVLKYNPATWRIPIDLTAGTQDPKQLLVTYSLQLLLVLIVYPVPNDEPNSFRKALSRLHRPEDFQFIQQGLTAILTQPVSGITSYLPSTSKAVPWAPDMLVLFWELLQCNKRFRSFIIDTDRAHDFVVLVLYYAMEAKDDPSKQGIVRMCVFILQTLSVEPSFGQRLNKPFTGQETLPTIMRIQNFHGSYADYLITSIHTILTTTKGRLESIYPALLAIINNIAPYVKDLQRATSSKLVELFSSMSSPTFLLANETNHTMLLSLLEAMNAILEHQYQENRRFVDVVVRSRKRFQALRNFTVEGAQAELDRQAQERKDRGGDVSVVRSRQASIESVRSPVSAQSPRLGNVPEDSTFAIGDDEDDEADEISNMARPGRPSSSVVEDAVPVQSRSMSEKARGKQPIGQGNFSRSTSRNASTSSLASITTNTPHQNGFHPSTDWLNEWLPHLPLHTILQVIAHNGDGSAAAQRRGDSTAAIAFSRPSGNQSTTKHSSPDETADTKPADSEPAGANRTGILEPVPELGGHAARVRSFRWDSPALGWYLSLLWSFIYAQDLITNRGNAGTWHTTDVKLFQVKEGRSSVPSLRSPKGAVDAVGASIASRISSLSLSRESVREV